MKFHMAMSGGVALAMLACSVGEGLAFVGEPATAVPVSFITQQADRPAFPDVLQVLAGGKRNVNVRRGGNVNVRRGANVNVNRGPTVNVNRGARVVVRPVRVWSPRPYYGRVVAGVALGTLIAVSVASVPPPAPNPSLCWYWTDSIQVNGYWDYCTPPR